MVRKSLAIASALALGFAPTAASAQSCSDLRAQRDQIVNLMAGIAADFPMTHMALAACLSNNPRSEDAQGCAGTVLTVACIGMGPTDCANLTSRWYKVVTAYQQVIEAMRQRECGS